MPCLSGQHFGQIAKLVDARFGTVQWTSLKRMLASYCLTTSFRHARTRVANTPSDDTGSHLAWDAQLRVEGEARPMVRYVYISGLNQDESLGIFRKLMYILRPICVDSVGQQVGKREIADVPSTMTTDEEVREPQPEYIILLVEPEGTVTAFDAL